MHRGVVVDLLSEGFELHRRHVLRSCQHLWRGESLNLCPGQAPSWLRYKCRAISVISRSWTVLGEHALAVHAVAQSQRCDSLCLTRGLRVAQQCCGSNNVCVNDSYCVARGSVSTCAGMVRAVLCLVVILI